MNLLARRAGLVLIASVLFLLSCDDDSFLLGIKGKTKFQGVYHEFVFDGEKSSVVLLDSVYTDQYALSVDPVNSFAYRYLIGNYNDPDFGTVGAQFFAQYLPNDTPPPNTAPLFNPENETLILDSTTVQILLDFYAYGPEVDINEQVNVFQLRELADSIVNSRRYFNYSTIGYDPIPVGSMRIKKYSNAFSGTSKIRPYNLTHIRFEEQADRSPGSRDTIMLQGRLDEEFSFRILDYIDRTLGDSAFISDELVTAFRKKWPGLAFVSTQTGRVLGLNPLNFFTQLTFHYHTATKSSVTTALTFYPYPWVGSNGFTNITTQRIGGLAGIDEKYDESYPPTNPDERYIQDGSTVITELDLSDFYSFIDTLEDIVINSAEISVAVKASPAGMPPPSSLYALLMKKTPDNKIVALNMSVLEDSVKMTHLSGNFYTDLINYAIPPELSTGSPLTLSFDANSNHYSGYATMFFQRLFDNKSNPDYAIERIGLYPAIAPLIRQVVTGGGTVNVPVLKSATGNTVNRAVLNTSGIKLKLYYTVPNKPNLE